jgi:hypothetical protein
LKQGSWGGAAGLLSRLACGKTQRYVLYRGAAPAGHLWLGPSPPQGVGGEPPCVCGRSLAVCSAKHCPYIPKVGTPSGSHSMRCVVTCDKSPCDLHFLRRSWRIPMRCGLSVSGRPGATQFVFDFQGAAGASPFKGWPHAVVPPGQRFEWCLGGGLRSLRAPARTRGNPGACSTAFSWEIERSPANGPHTRLPPGVLVPLPSPL